MPRPVGGIEACHARSTVRAMQFLWKRELASDDGRATPVQRKITRVPRLSSRVPHRSTLNHATLITSPIPTGFHNFQHHIHPFNFLSLTSLYSQNPFSSITHSKTSIFTHKLHQSSHFIINHQSHSFISQP
jgi:hypothetical protein